MITRDIACNRLYYNMNGQLVKQQGYKRRLNTMVARQMMIITEDVSSNLVGLHTAGRKDF